MWRIQRSTGVIVVAITFVYLFALGIILPQSHPQLSRLITTYIAPPTPETTTSTTSTTPKPKLVGPPILLSPHAGQQTYPRAIRLRSGSLLASLTVFEPENAIQLVISRDDGASWSPHGTVISKPIGDATPVDNAVLLELPSGRILCALRAHTKELAALNAEEKPGGQNEGYLYYQLIIYLSDDSGKTWRYLSTPTHEPGPAHGNWEPFLRLSNTGHLQFFYSREIGGGKDQDNLMRNSHDDGMTWSDAQTVSGMDLVTRDGMMGIQEVVPGSGHLMAVFETVEEKGEGTTFEARFEVWSVTSRDDGKTWGERRMIYDSWYEDAKSRFKRNAGAPSIALVGKTLVISFMTDEEKLEGMWHKNAYIKIITSDDGGLTWGNKLIIVEKPAAWAGLLPLNATNFMVLCEHGDRVEGQHLTLT